MEYFANKYENAINKGFIHTVIISILNNGPSHGYSIKKQIETSSLGNWEIPDSTLYTVLKQMTGKGLIEFEIEANGERKKKIYHLTDKGEKLYELILDRQENIFNSMISLLDQIIPDESSELARFIHLMKIFSPISPDQKLIETKSDEEKLEIYEEIKQTMQHLMQKSQETFEMVNERIEQLKGTIKTTNT